MEVVFLGDYQILKEIGTGSLGETYLAEQRFTKKSYVLKVFPEELSSDRGFIQRFQEDVAILSGLEHPYIAKILNVSFAEGRYFLVMECVVDQLGETVNLGSYLLSRGKRLSEKELYQILHQVAEALDYAHKKMLGGKPLVHRSLKPSNILISGDRVLVSDFGLSRLIGPGRLLARIFKEVAEELVETTERTPHQQNFLQTLAFLAPEQKRIEQQVDIKTDSYAFGVLAYYLMFLSYPEGIFPLPSSKNWGYHWNWDQLLISCLAKDPELRPASLVQTLDAVQGAHASTTADRPQVRAEEKELVHTGGALRPVIQSSRIERPEHDADPGSIFKIDSTVKVYQPEAKEAKLAQPIQTEMVVIAGGSFNRGSNDGNRDEMPKHRVTISDFAIDVHPVTNEQFARFLEAMGGEKDANHNDLIRLKESRMKRTAGKVTIESGYSKHPVVGVTWYGAVAYAKWVGKRLPYEVEWEIAARGGDSDALFPTGEDIEKSQANFFSSDTTAVMSYPPNAFGLYDVAGNVYEWCNDWYGYNSYEASFQEPENPKGPVQGVYRVLRGGCWKSLKEDLRCSRRHRNNPGTVNSTYGFRCAADVG